MRIECPNCQASYEVPEAMLQPEGREVKCASCKDTWFASISDTTIVAPQNDIIDVTPEPEGELLHDGMNNEDIQPSNTPSKKPKKSKGKSSSNGIFAKIFGLLSSNVSSKNKKALNQKQVEDPRLIQRQTDLLENLPQAKLRRNLSLFGVGMLACIFSAGVIFSTNIVRAVPDLASFYAKFGMEINLHHVAIEDVTSEVQQIDGQPTLVVSGNLRNLSIGETKIPNMQVALLGTQEAEIYAWAVTPTQANLKRGEKLTFETQLVNPPENATQIELVFEKPNN